MQSPKLRKNSRTEPTFVVETIRHDATSVGRILTKCNNVSCFRSCVVEPRHCDVRMRYYKHELLCVLVNVTEFTRFCVGRSTS